MNLLLNFSNLLKIRTDIILYICAAICFAGFLVVLLWYLLYNKRTENNKPTKSWTIESAKKFLESQNVQIKESSDEKANLNTKLAPKNVKSTSGTKTSPKTQTNTVAKPNTVKTPQTNISKTEAQKAPSIKPKVSTDSKKDN